MENLLLFFLFILGHVGSLTGQLSVTSNFEPTLFDAARFDAALDHFKLA
jgi:hypothetical protein